jgi:hypothetical protein
MATVTGYNFTNVAAGYKGPWVDQLLNAIGAPTSDANRAALRLWAASEGTVNSNNPLAISATPNGQTGCIAQCGTANPIYSYNSMTTGVQNTANFLKGYPGIVAAFRQDAGIGPIWAAINGSPWCKGCQGGLYPVQMHNFLFNPGGGGITGGVNPANGGAPTQAAGPNQAAGQGGACPDPTSTSFQWQRKGGCCNNVYLFNFSPGHFLTECQAQAVLGGALMLAGAGVMLLGALMVAAFGLKVAPAKAALPTAIVARQRVARASSRKAEDADELRTRRAEERASQRRYATGKSRPMDERPTDRFKLREGEEPFAA